MLNDILTPQQLTQWIALIREAKRVVVIGHFGPDGDALGSTLGLASYLYGMGKHARVVMPNSFADYLHSIPRAEHVLTYDRHAELITRHLREADVIFCLDFNTLSRLESMCAIVKASAAKKVMIDHHEAPDDFADLTISHPKLSSTSEMVFRIIWQLGGYEQLTLDAATALYTGMMTDTGGFTYNSNDPDIYFIISQLLRKGVNKDQIYRNIFHAYSEGRMRLMGYVMYEKLEMLADGRASVFALTAEEQARFCYTRGDSEGFVNMPLSIKDVELSVSLREDTDKGLIRVSTRSETSFPCNLWAAEFFNGGGHHNAAGGSMPCTMDEALVRVRLAVEAWAHLLPEKKKK
ncbi:MAG: DHH family phosphoesterase [Bacteroidales bacterium]|nr:DHH family phosphoesterase [Bacteroidales bacterium]